MKLLLFFFIAAIPIVTWIVVFYKIRPEKKSMLFFAFIAGCFSPLIILLYQKFWGGTVNLIFFEFTPVNFKESLTEFSTRFFLQKFLVFVFGVGMMEEFVKHFVVRKEKPAGLVMIFVLILISFAGYVLFKLISGTIDSSLLLIFGALTATFYIFILVHKNLDFKSIDQVILVSIMSALGFAFIENIIYFLRLTQGSGLNTAGVTGILLIRSLFVVMVHILCSGIFGYYYGLSLFAAPYLQEQEVRRKKFFLLEWTRKILRFSKKTIFAEEKLLEGLVLAMVFHGVYDFILEVNLSLSDFFDWFGIKTTLAFPLYTLIMVVYLFGGFWFLRKLLQEKNNHLKFGLVGTSVMPEEDYINLIQRVKKMGQEQTLEKQLTSDKNWGTKEDLLELRQKIRYLQKFKLLEDKYLNTKWMSAENFQHFRKEINKIKQLQSQKIS